jgi:short-subunit dehydrogenase
MGQSYWLANRVLRVQIGPGTRVLVTGASRGIGEAVANAFAARGCEVGRVSRTRESAADVADPASISAAVSRFGDVDVLVANAGIAHYLPFKDMPLSTAEELTRVNWMGTVHTVHAALPGMLERRRGWIAIVSSGAGLRSFPNAAVYGATKAAQRGFGEALWHELKGTGVGLTMVYPGQIHSSLHDHERERMPSWYKPGRTVPPEPLADAIVAGVEKESREVFYPRNVRLLRIAHGIRPGLADLVLRRIMDRSAAP